MKTIVSAPISLLFPPNVIPVIDLFRAFGASDGHGSMATMDNLEPALAALIGVEAARTAASDILLFSFALRRKRKEPLVFHDLHDRGGTADEFCLLTLLSAAAGMDDQLRDDAVCTLGINGEASLISLAEDIAKSLRFLPFKASFLASELFNAVMGTRMGLSEKGRADLITGYSRFQFPSGGGV